MVMKVGRGRGKKGDGLTVDKASKKHSYGKSRNLAMMSNDKISGMLETARRKDFGKLAVECEKRGM